jgi:hypothetical protein
LEPPGQGDTAITQAERLIFLREKFSFGAFLFGPLWLIGHRLWLELIVYLAGLAVAGTVLYALGVGSAAGLLIFGLFQMLLGMEATSLLRWKRVRSGWRDGGVVIADDLDLAERRFFDDRFTRRAAKAAQGPAPFAPLPPPPFPGAAAAPSGPAVTGLFPEPGGGR